MNEQLQSSLIKLAECDARCDEATSWPYFAIVSGKVRMKFERGIWFSRKAAQDHLDSHKYRYSKTCYVYCYSGSDSKDWQDLLVGARLHSFENKKEATGDPT